MSAEKMIAVATAEVGYLEKASVSQLNDKTANAGNANITKYWVWYGSLQGNPWCDAFVSWCGAQAGEADAIGKFAYCPSHVNWFKNRKQWHARGSTTPQPGDIIFFQSGGVACHVGIVEYVAGNYVYTIEGNASGSSGLTPNGGGVVQKHYPLTSAYILGYGRPAYAESAITTAGTTFFSSAKTYKNKSTSTPVFSETTLTTKTGSLNGNETCECLAIINGRYLVKYKVDGSNAYKTGFVAYSGGVS